MPDEKPPWLTPRQTTALDLVGAALVVVGVALIWLPAAVILAGLALIAISWRAAH